MGNTILGANTLSSGYEVANSCMFNDGDSACMHKTPSSSGNRRTFTFSTWVKKTNDLTSNVYNDLYSAYDDANNISRILFWDSNALTLSNKVSGSFPTFIRTNRLFKDPTAWYHLVIAVDTTDGTEANRVKIYVNGIQETSLESSNYPSQNEDFFFNHTNEHNVGQQGDDDSALYFDGYLAETVMIDGLQLAPTSFGEFDEDTPKTWKPIDVSGLTFGTNGFYLDYEDSSNLGNDKSGGTDFTEVNLAATDQSTDTCTNNFATLNPLVKGNTSFTFLQGNIQVDSGNNWGHGVGTIGLASGKWYWEVDNITASSNVFFGICNEFNVSHLDNDSTPYSEAGLMLYFQDGRRTIDGTSSEGEYNAYGTTHGFALDLDSGTRTIKFYRDNSLEGTENLTANFPAGDFVFPILMMSASSNACGVDFNFGGTVASALASGNADANGYGSFEFAPPNGHYAICTKNLADYG